VVLCGLSADQELATFANVRISRYLSALEVSLHCTLVEEAYPHLQVYAMSNTGELLIGSRVESPFVAPCTQAAGT
jgi:hypothetical protein